MMRAPSSRATRKPGQRRIGDLRQAFMSEIVDDRQDAKPPAISERVR
jgi:hypothetical protein